MSDDLRERIAKAIHTSSYNVMYPCIGMHASRLFADAIISELSDPSPESSLERLSADFKAYCNRCGIPHDGMCRRDN